MHEILCSVLTVFLLKSAFSDELPPPCFSNIYCHGRLLHAIQTAKIYEDSKDFVDMKMRYYPNETLDRFDQFMLKFNNKPNKAQVKAFVDETFEKNGQEFEPWEPYDWIKHPKFVDAIVDEQFKDWALELNAIWKILGRSLKHEVKENIDLYSVIWVPNPVIIPGGRFREFYYWDTYWIAEGLLLSEMVETFKGMLGNFLYIVNKYGHIPNGGRIYYLARSQPPLLTPMVKLYIDHTNDLAYLKENIETLEAEFSYWMTNHTTIVHLNDKNYTVAIYGDKSQGPRPESYTEDIDTARSFSDARKEDHYSELKAAAESGWDFSSRWFIDGNGTNKGNLTNLKTRSIVPVDLNSLMYWNAMLLAEFNQKINNPEKADYYQQIAKDWMEAVQAVLWHEEDGIWLDYDLYNKKKRDYFYPTNIAPFWTGCYNKTNKDHIVRLVMKYLQTKHIMNTPGGIPSTMEHTGEQWDYPNAWPPLQYIMIVALNNTGDEAAGRLAFEMAQKWVRSNFKAYMTNNAMFEKYDATVSGGYGGGGEYILQTGFGWTNGIIMYLLNKYSSTLRAQDPEPMAGPPTLLIQSASSLGQGSTVMLALLVSLTAGFIGVFIYKRRNAIGSTLSTAPASSRVKYTELRSMPHQTKYAR